MKTMRISLISTQFSAKLSRNHYFLLDKKDCEIHADLFLGLAMHKKPYPRIMIIPSLFINFKIISNFEIGHICLCKM